MGGRERIDEGGVPIRGGGMVSVVVEEENGRGEERELGEPLVRAAFVPGWVRRYTKSLVGLRMIFDVWSRFFGV